MECKDAPINPINHSAVYTGVLIRIQSTSGREVSSNPTMHGCGLSHRIESGLVGVHTRGELGRIYRLKVVDLYYMQKALDYDITRPMHI